MIFLYIPHCVRYAIQQTENSTHFLSRNQVMIMKNNNLSTKACTRIFSAKDIRYGCHTQQVLSNL